MTDSPIQTEKSSSDPLRTVHTSIRNEQHITICLKCPCCGSDMTPDRDIGASTIFKCSECGLSDSVLKEKTDAS